MFHEFIHKVLLSVWRCLQSIYIEYKYGVKKVASIKVVESFLYLFFSTSRVAD